MTATDSYIVPVKVQSRLREGQIVKMSDLLKEVAKPAAPDEVKITPVPLPTAITPDEKVALERLMDVYGSVVPSERRRLEPAEVSKALVERGVLKTVEAIYRELEAEWAAVIGARRVEALRADLIHVQEGLHGGALPPVRPVAR